MSPKNKKTLRLRIFDHPVRQSAVFYPIHITVLSFLNFINKPMISVITDFRKHLYNYT